MTVYTQLKSRSTHDFACCVVHDYCISFYSGFWASGAASAFVGVIFAELHTCLLFIYFCATLMICLHLISLYINIGVRCLVCLSPSRPWFRMPLPLWHAATGLMPPRFRYGEMRSCLLSPRCFYAIIFIYCFWLFSADIYIIFAGRFRYQWLRYLRTLPIFLVIYGDDYAVSLILSFLFNRPGINASLSGHADFARLRWWWRQPMRGERRIALRRHYRTLDYVRFFLTPSHAASLFLIGRLRNYRMIHDALAITIIRTPYYAADK